MQDISLKRIIENNRVGLGTIEGNLLSAAGGKDIRTLFVTSARPREGKTSTAASLAYGLSVNSGDPILLIEGSTTHPCFHQLFSLDDKKPGFADYLLERASLEQVVQPTEFDGIMVIPGGNSGADKDWRGALKEDVFKVKLADLKKNYAYVVFDGDALFASSVPSIQARHFDGVILTVECGKTKWEVLNLAREKISNTGANVVGVVLNKREYAIPSKVYSKV